MLVNALNAKKKRAKPIDLTVCLTENASYAILTIVDVNNEYVDEIDICFHCKSYLNDMDKSIEEFHDYLIDWATRNYPRKNVRFNVEDEIYDTTFNLSFMTDDSFDDDDEGEEDYEYIDAILDMYILDDYDYYNRKHDFDRY